MRHLAVLLLGAVTLAACAATSEDEEGNTSLNEATVTSLDPNGSPQVALTDPPVLRALEAKGFAFGHHFGVADAAQADVLMGSPTYAAIAKGIIANLDALKAGDRALGVGMSFDHRMFDPKWLSSSRSHFVLTAITNRFDRAPLSGSCGETRFVFRLEYADPREGASSRMPMTVAVVLPQTPRAGEVGCAASAKRWMALSGGGAALADLAARGPLASLPPRIAVETNLQAVRWPSSVKKDLGGEGEYMMSVWDVAANGAVTSSALDNTPDVDAITKDASKKAALLDWLKTNVLAIDRGTAKLPETLAAHTAYSYGPRGLARLANRPFTSLLDGVDLGVSFREATFAKSAPGLLRKLDESTCQGCHQARAMAGFHVLGNEDDNGTNDKLNRLAVGTSPHFNEELGWRLRLAQAVAGGADPATLPEPRPFADHATSDGLRGASCGLDGDVSFAGWTCASGLKCADMIGEPHVGVCTSFTLKPGDACEKDTIVSSAASPRTDAVTNHDTGDIACAKAISGGSCSGASGGFPGGSCAAPCAKLGVLKDGALCGAAPPAGFNECMAAGTTTFEDCMSPPKLSQRQGCSVTAPCRDDYVCAYVPGSPAGVGACMPPYFIFQARVDGHD